MANIPIDLMVNRWERMIAFASIKYSIITNIIFLDPGISYKERNIYILVTKIYYGI
jgi:hypothetical protein